METATVNGNFGFAMSAQSENRAALGSSVWSDLYDQHSRAIFYLALRTVGDATLAEDITHDVFLKAFRHWDQFRQQSSVRTWLYRITINHCRSLQSKWSQRHILSTDDSAILDAPGTATDNPFRNLEVKELGQRIQKTLDALPDEYRLMLLLVADEKLSYEEIAELTEQSPDSVRGKLYRARKAFTTEFQKSS
jgi:RNA polymerase sigma-70 factor (ECF subfamily)